MTVLIFANGDLKGKDWVFPYLKEASIVIAADGGSEYLWYLNHLPDVVIGDLDSLSQPVTAWLGQFDVQIHKVSEDKDETDLELALLHAVNHSQETIYIFAAVGGRLDQTLANILLLAHPDLIGRRVEIVTEKEHAWLITDETIITGRSGDLVSLIPLGGDVQIIRTEGLQWPLINEALRFGPARGISNRMTSNTAAVTVASGKLLCIHTPNGGETDTH